MNRTLSRQALYDLLWSIPAGKIAHDLGISNALLGKICMRFNIPKPSVGYWRQLETGKGSPTMPLPPLLPFECEYNIMIAARNQPYPIMRTDEDSSWRPPDNLTDPLPALRDAPPLTIADIEGMREWGLKLTESFTFKHSYTGRRHTAIDSAIDNDRKRLRKEDEYGRHIKPLTAAYRSDDGLLLLKHLHHIFWGLKDLGAHVTAYGHEHPYWFEIQALGYEISMIIVDYKAQGLKQPVVDGLPVSYGYRWYPGSISRYLGLLDSVINPIPTTAGITFYQFVIAELALQVQIAKHHKAMAQFKADVTRRDAVVEKRKAYLVSLEVSRRESIKDTLSRIADAERLRNLISVLDDTEIPTTLEDNYSSWKAWAKEYLAEIDPRMMTTKQAESWLSSYQFGIQIPLE